MPLLWHIARGVPHRPATAERRRAAGGIGGRLTGPAGGCIVGHDFLHSPRPGPHACNTLRGHWPYRGLPAGEESRVDLSGYAEHAVRLANTEGDEQQAGDAEDDHSISTLEGLRGLLTALRFPDTRVTRGDLDAMQALRVEFRKIFGAAASGNGSEAVDRLNALLIQHPVHPQILRHDDEPWHLHLTQGGSVADRYAAGAAMGLANLITQFGINRLGVCAAPSCPRVFIDTSSNRSRRYCSDRCVSRANVTAFRSRRRSGTPDVLPTAAV